MKVSYKTGEIDVIDFNADLKAGENSRDINVDATRELKKVSFIYHSIPNTFNDKAHLELYGLK